MATIVHLLWLAAEWALLSCNDLALWNFSRLFWVASKSKTTKNNNGQKVVQLYFQYKNLVLSNELIKVELPLWKI